MLAAEEIDAAFEGVPPVNFAVKFGGGGAKEVSHRLSLRSVVGRPPNLTANLTAKSTARGSVKVTFFALPVKFAVDFLVKDG